MPQVAKAPPAVSRRQIIHADSDHVILECTDLHSCDDLADPIQLLRALLRIQDDPKVQIWGRWRCMIACGIDGMPCEANLLIHGASHQAVVIYLGSCWLDVKLTTIGLPDEQQIAIVRPAPLRGDDLDPRAIITWRIS